MWRINSPVHGVQTNTMTMHKQHYLYVDRANSLFSDWAGRGSFIGIAGMSLVFYAWGIYAILILFPLVACTVFLSMKEARFLIDNANAKSELYVNLFIDCLASKIAPYENLNIEGIYISQNSIMERYYTLGEYKCGIPAIGVYVFILIIQAIVLQYIYGHTAAMGYLTIVAPLLIYPLFCLHSVSVYYWWKRFYNQEYAKDKHSYDDLIMEMHASIRETMVQLKEKQRSARGGQQ